MIKNLTFTLSNMGGALCALPRHAVPGCVRFTAGKGL